MLLFNACINCNRTFFTGNDFLLAFNILKRALNLQYEMWVNDTGVKQIKS